MKKLKPPPVGLWFDSTKGTNKIIIKVSTYLIKDINSGVRTDLITAVYNNLDDTYPMLGLRIFDDPNYPSLVTERVETKQLTHFKNVILSEQIGIEFYDELGFPSLLGSVYLDGNVQSDIAQFYDIPNKFSEDRDSFKANQLLDYFSISLEEEKATDKIIKIGYFNIKFHDLAPVENFKLQKKIFLQIPFSKEYLFKLSLFP